MPVGEERLSSPTGSFCPSSERLLLRKPIVPSGPRTPQKINPESLSHCSAVKTDHRTHHVYHASHHKLTSKTPRFAVLFLQNPLQKRSFRLPPNLKGNTADLAILTENAWELETGLSATWLPLEKALLGSNPPFRPIDG
jgi:hypothetical protein